MCAFLKVTRLFFLFLQPTSQPTLLIHSNQFSLSSILKQLSIYSSTLTTCLTTYVLIHAFMHTWFHQSFLPSAHPPTHPSIHSNLSYVSIYTFIYLLTYSLTPWCRVLLEKLTGLQLVKKFPAFHGTRRFITALTSVCHLSLSWASPIQSIYPHPTSWRPILILSTHLRRGLPSGLFPYGFLTKTLYAPSLLTHTRDKC